MVNWNVTPKNLFASVYTLCGPPAAFKGGGPYHPDLGFRDEYGRLREDELPAASYEIDIDVWLAQQRKQ